MSPWIPFNLLPADTLPEWILVALAGLDLLLKIVALGWIPHRRRPSVALAWLRGRPGVVAPGRDLQIVEAADLVTEMTKVKHPFDQGQKGQKGIEW